jgi:TonB-linked SusC/RagA family outer membrane protein
MLISIAFLTLPQNSFAATAETEMDQATMLSGTVADGAGEPLAGVLVTVKGNSSNAAITDAEGRFSIGVPSGTTLEFSLYGYSRQEVAATAGMSVVLSEDIGLLDEVIVVGYGTQRKGSIVGSVANINSEVITRAPAANLSNSLAGKLPGLRVVTRTGMPGSNDSSIDIRGFGAALIIVDGIPVYNNNTNGMSQLDPNDIESVTVLKDASAAVYGVKTANGVLLVTTKRGKAGEAKISLSSTFSWQRPTVYPEMVNAAQFVELRDENSVNRGLAPEYGKEVLDKYRAGAPGYESYDWYKAVVRPWSPQQQYNVNVRGGNENVSYFTSLGYVSEDGMWRSGDLNYQRFNARANLDAKMGRGWSISTSVAGRKEDTDSPNKSITDIMAGIQKNFPMFSPYANNNENYYAQTNDVFNPLAYTDSNTVGYSNDLKHSFEGSMTLKYDAGRYMKGLSAKAMYYYRYTNITDKTLTKKFNLYTYDNETDVYTAHQATSLSSLTEHSYRDEAVNFQGSVDYANSFGKHDVTGMLVFETRQNKENYLQAYRSFTIDAIDEIGNGDSDSATNGGTSYQLANIGYIGRFTYAYDQRYLFKFSFRRDGSSKFPKDGRWGFFPSVSAGWRISEEAFLKDNSVIDNLKLRASWGRLGDEQNGWNSYSYVTGYTYPSGNYILGGSSLTSGLVDRGMANPRLTWFTSDLYDIGLDFDLFRGKLSGAVDVFYRKREGLLATRASSLPGTFGASFPQENLNSDSHRGFEIELGHRNTLANGLTYAVKGNVAYTRQKWGHYEQTPPAYQWQNWYSHHSNRWQNRAWGYTAIGQFESFEEIASSPQQDAKGNTTLMPGDIKYLDYNGDNVIDGQDQHLIGRGNMPEYTFGLDISASWKGFDFVAFLQGAANFNVGYGGQYASPFFNGESTLAAFADRWHHEDIYDPTSPWVAGKYPSTYSNGNPNNTRFSTFWLQDCSYLRLKELQLGYTIPEKITQRAGISSLRVFVTGYNLFTWTGTEFLDPESLSNNGRYYPQQKSLAFGLNLSF